MNPWTIIGWGLLACAALVVALLSWFVVEVHVAPWLFGLWHHRKTRNTKPRAGQVWIQGKSQLVIGHNARTDRIVMKSGNASWSDSPDEWRLRVKERKLWLLWDVPAPVERDADGGE